jgi:hypothetical protein
MASADLYKKTDDNTDTDLVWLLFNGCEFQINHFKHTFIADLPYCSVLRSEVNTCPPPPHLTGIAHATSNRKYIYSPVSTAVWPASGIKRPDSDSVSFNDTVTRGMILIILHYVKTLLPCSHTSALSTCFQTVCPFMSTPSHSSNLILLPISRSFYMRKKFQHI